MSGDNTSAISAINGRLGEILGTCRESPLREAMAYSVNSGGKRLRPQLLLAACESVCGGYDAIALDFACAIEMIHTYSLIHDDLPAMDDDATRRGKPACHIAHGEAMAILAGDALLNTAYEVMAAACLRARNKKGALRAMSYIARMAGCNGMVAGQAADIKAEEQDIGADALLGILRRKTGMLIKACLVAGAFLGDGQKRHIHAFARVGAALGLAFQIRDDILDGSAESVTGKPKGSDERNGKKTYVTVYGIPRAKERLRNLSCRINSQLDSIPQQTDALRNLVSWMENRSF